MQADVCWPRLPAICRKGSRDRRQDLKAFVLTQGSACCCPHWPSVGCLDVVLAWWNSEWGGYQVSVLLTLDICTAETVPAQSADWCWSSTLSSREKLLICSETVEKQQCTSGKVQCRYSRLYLSATAPRQCTLVLAPWCRSVWWYH